MKSSVKRVFIGWGGLIGIAAIGVGIASLSAPSPQGTLTEQDLLLVEHLAASEVRKATDRAQVTAWTDYIRNGMERGAAGFHLLRPIDDPAWDNRGSTGNGSEWQWVSVPVQYSEVEYQRLTPTQIQPHPNNGSCYASLSRAWGNSLCTASIVDIHSVPSSVQVEFSPRSLGVLRKLIEDKSEDTASGSYVDWFGTGRQTGTSATGFVAVLIFNEVAYLPIRVQDLIAAGPGPVRVVVAHGLTNIQAQHLVAALNAP